jgi:pimeloyl-ACP methyl ester carboxylesterase
LHGLHIPPSRRGEAIGPLVLGFGGNAWNADAVAAFLHDCFPETDVVAFHYRGYPPSNGQPGAPALFEDAVLIHDSMNPRFRGRAIVAVGFSIGSGIAARLSSRRPVAGLILVTPFDSLAGVGSHHYPWLPVRLLFRHEMNAARDLARFSGPVALIAAERDTIIPPARTAALRASVRRAVYDRTIPGRGHNDLYGDPAFGAAMREAMGAIQRAGPAA